MPKTDQKMLAATVTEVTDLGKVVNEHTDVITDNYRRLTALEAHITDLEERLNARGVFSGDCHVPGNPAHLWESNA